MKRLLFVVMILAVLTVTGCVPARRVDVTWPVAGTGQQQTPQATQQPVSGGQQGGYGEDLGEDEGEFGGYGGLFDLSFGEDGGGGTPGGGASGGGTDTSGGGAGQTAPAEYKAYNLVEITDPQFSNMVALRTLLPGGWSMDGGVNWAVNSANAPAQIWFQASSGDGSGFVCYKSPEHYAMQYTYGSPTVAWGFPQREPISAEQAARSYLSDLGVSGISFTSTLDADPEGREWDLLTPYLQSLREQLAMAYQELQNPSFSHMIYEGTGNLNGTPCDVRVDVAVSSHRAYASAITVDYSSVSGTTVMLAPLGRMGDYLADMLVISGNGIINQNWQIGINQVSSELWAILRQQQSIEWAAARRMSAQLSARVDSIIDHTNAWIASTDAMMEQHSSNWSDYILDQSNYVAGDGSTVSVDSSWDHVWLGNDGSVYVSNQSDLFDNPNTNPNLTTYYTELEQVD